MELMMRHLLQQARTSHHQRVRIGRVIQNVLALRDEIGVLRKALEGFLGVSSLGGALRIVQSFAQYFQLCQFLHDSALSFPLFYIYKNLYIDRYSSLLSDVNQFISTSFPLDK